MSRLVSQPDIKNPILPSEGFNMRKATRHKFVGFEPFVIKFTSGPKTVQGLVYECTETNARRRWGYQ
jgi:hypothetical protein